MRFALSVFFALTFAHTLFAQDPALVAPTNALTPAEEQKKLIVPEGFQIQLVASEPDIQKPMQQAFDAKGRMWVTTSYHYPFAAPAGKGTDKLFILSDFGPDGKAKKIQTFAADLNIPIGILPLPDCNSCIVSSVGEILKLTDTDGDGKYDKKEVLFTGFGSRDTHGMYNSFTMMPDGWVYACHGFNNDSKTKGKDGHEVAMRSGNTFRFRPDGSRIEVYTRGQVNPFGMAVDPWFNLYTADCHSKPITQLIPGATYESFNSTSDPLGFAPVMFGYDPGGTGLCGVSWYDADHFPKEFKGCMFLGNVVTSRVNMCRVQWTGATPKAVQQPDFVKSNDPWFRPVDIKLGPDGAIYISDFYNKVIGHYEVDLKHPGRDKDRGRLWRVVYTGKDGKVEAPKMPYEDLTKSTPADLVKLLEHPNMSVRMAVVAQLISRKGEWWGAFPQMKGGDDAGVKNQARVYAPFPMMAENAGILKRDTDYHGFFPLLLLAGDDPAAVELAVGISRGLATRKELGEGERKFLLGMLNPSDMEKQNQTLFKNPFVQRAIVEAIMVHPHSDFVRPLVGLLGTIPVGDATLKHATRIALRNCLREEKAWEIVKKIPGNSNSIIDIAIAARNGDAAEYLAFNFKAGTMPSDKAVPAAEVVGSHGSYKDWEMFLQEIRAEKNGVRALEIMQSLVRGVALHEDKTKRVEVFLKAILDRVSSELNEGKRESKLASLRLLTDLTAVVPIGGPQVFLKNETIPILIRLVMDRVQSEDVRGDILPVLVKLDAKTGLTTSEKLIDAVDTSPILRERAALILAASSDRNHKQAAKDAIKSVPYRSGVTIATALAGTAVGGEILLNAVKQGTAPARVLQEKVVLDRLRAAKIDNLDKQLADLTQGLQPADQKLAELIKQRTVKFTSAKIDKEAGLKLFTKHCGACHKIGEAGGKIGPNLDGIGVRGLERLLEDTLDPNRNVDAAFRARVLELADGTSKTGLMLRVEGEVLVMADDMGKEFRIPTKDIEKNRETSLSPMPANFGEAIPEAEFFQLIGYLLDQKTKEPPKK